MELVKEMIMKFKTLIPAIVVGLLVTACGGDDDSSGATVSVEDLQEWQEEEESRPTCEDWTTREVTEAEVEAGCAQGDGAIAGTATFACADGRTLYWNDAVWGYVGEPAHAHEEGAEQVAPEQERTSCNG